MTNKVYPNAVHAHDVPEPLIQTKYPEPFASMVRGRVKRKLGEVFGLETFGVNRVRMAPGSVSSVPHYHSAEDEFIYMLDGCLVLVTGETETLLEPGMCAGFKAGSGIPHQLKNVSTAEATFLEVGSRIKEDAVEYPYHDLALHRSRAEDSWVFSHKDGNPY